MKTIKALFSSLLLFSFTTSLFSAEPPITAIGYVKMMNLQVGSIYIIANPLSNSSNYLNNVLKLPDSADGTTVFFFDMFAQEYNMSTFYSGYGWYPDIQVNPGEAFFFKPMNCDEPTLSIRFTGTVVQGCVTNTLPAYPRYSLKSSITPHSLYLGNEYTGHTLGFPAEEGDTVMIWSAYLKEYLSYSYYEGYGWVNCIDSENVMGPFISVGTGFFVQKGPDSVKLDWVRNYTVNPYDD